MKANTIEDVLKRQPFQPFLVAYDGTPVRVEHPEQALFNNSRTVLIVVSRDDRIHILDVDHIKAVTLDPRRRKAAV
jgi:hypothetical protein